MANHLPMAERVPETDSGQQGTYIAQKYDAMQRHIRDHGWLKEKVDLLLRCGLVTGKALEVGMGPGYLGLEWLKCTSGARSLTGLDLSPEMVEYAQRNRAEYGLGDLAAYCLGDALHLPFDDGTFDCVFSYGSLHEWNDPKPAFEEIDRVLREGGRYCVIDLRRDLDRQALRFMRINIDIEMRAGFMSSLKASYLSEELRRMVTDTALRDATIAELELGIYLTGEKVEQTRMAWKP